MTNRFKTQFNFKSIRFYFGVKIIALRDHSNININTYTDNYLTAQGAVYGGSTSSLELKSNR